MLVACAHPGDESFATGGTIAKYARVGWQIDLVCATRAGGQLGEVRQVELQQAAGILGISSVTLLDFSEGTLFKQHAGEIEDKLSRLMAQLSPNIVITFEPQGIDNDPDRIKLSLSTTFAFQKYARNVAFADTAIQAPKLYYVCMPQSVADYLKKNKVIPAESFGKFLRGTPDKRITAVVDVQSFLTKKVKALWAHETQRDDVLQYLSLRTNPLIRQEYFIQRFEGVKEVFMGKNDRVGDKL